MLHRVIVTVGTLFVKQRISVGHGEFRTKRWILEMVDEMAEAMRMGAAYVTRLEPPPAEARVAHVASDIKEMVG